MSNFKLVIDYIFSMLSQVWNTINSHWLLQIMFALVIIGFIVDLTVQTTPKE